MFYKLLIRPVLFLFAPEQIHHFTFAFIKFFCQIPLAKTLLKGLYGVKKPHLHKKLMGLDFPNPIGLAAGFDKDAKLVDELACLGFGFIEIGTLTPQPQDGNPQPRLFRLPKDQALINRMGFNNGGVTAAVQRLKNRKSSVIIGGNIGKNKITPNEEAVNDYVKNFEALYEVVDYFVVNVSSPNTPNLRQLQEKEPLQHLLQTLQHHNQQKPQPKPILLKIAPDLTTNQLDDIVEIVQTTRIQGIIATNTTINRNNLNTSNEELTAIGAGGLSGKPLKNAATEIIRYLRNKLGKDVVMIGVGGIFTAADAQEKLQAGADLVQVYTGFIYEGAGIVKNICNRLAN